MIGSSNEYYSENVEIVEEGMEEMHSGAHYSKSQIFVQKFNFDQTPTISRVFTQIFFDYFSREIKVVNS